jgi:hypothetical protein
MRYIYDYAYLLNYHSRGTSAIARNSVQFGGALKNAVSDLLNSVSVVIQGRNPYFNEFLSPERNLIPVPRSAPLLSGALWPTKILSETLVQNGLGNNVYPIIKRIRPVPKSSSLNNANDRPSIQTHIDSLTIEPLLGVQTNAEINFTIVDDILTLGRTTSACAFKLKEFYPNSDIKIFAVMRTKNLNNDDINTMIEPHKGQLQYNTETGKSWFIN